MSEVAKVWVIRTVRQTTKRQDIENAPFLAALEGRAVEPRRDGGYHSVWRKKIHAESWLRNHCQSSQWEKYGWELFEYIPDKISTSGEVSINGTPFIVQEAVSVLDDDHLCGDPS